MANIQVLESHQDISEIPTGGRIKRSAGQKRVRNGMAVWIEKNVLIQMLPANTLQISSTPPSDKSSAYIPQSMPPVEVSGLHFEDPVKALQSIRRFHVIVANGIGGRCEA